MTIIIYQHPTNEIRGKTRRYLYELRPNIFAGKISDRVRQSLWNELCKNNAQAVMIYDTNNEQGFASQTTGFADEGFSTDMDGVFMRTITKPALRWRDIKAKPYITLEEHMLDVGFLAEAFMQHGSLHNIVAAFAERTQNRFDEVVSTFAAICALHDIGKCHPAFQTELSKHDEMLAEELQHFNASHTNPDFRHERYSVQLLNELNIENAYMHVIAYHHLCKAGSITEKYNCPNEIMWHALQQEGINNILQQWPIYELRGRFYKNMGANILLGMIIQCDWIASGQEWASFKQDNCILTPQALAQKFLQEQKMDNTTLSDILQNVDFETAFGFTPNALQLEAMRIAREYEPDVTIIQYPCGGGKSEAGCAVCAISGKNMGGIHLGMPTNATAEGIVGRMRKIAKNCGIQDNIPEFCGHAMFSENPEDHVDPFFLAHRSRFHANYPFAVETVDQQLKSICRYRYSALPLVALSNKALLVDEVHAYDMFMQTELEQRIRWCVAAKQPIVLLSATMSTKQKTALLKAAGARNFQCSNQYPVITIVKDGQVHEFSIQKTGRMSRKVQYCFKRVHDIAAELCAVCDNPPEGVTGLICPDVDSAQRLYEYAKSKKHSDTIIINYHSRDTLAHKSEKIKLIEKLFGKDRTQRPRRALLISTPIIEQSLDIDLDYLWTSIAPIDLLIQRLGRWHRHDDVGTVRENGPLGVSVHILVPEQYGTLALIYNKDVLQATERVLERHNEFDTVDDVCAMIDDVYDNVDTSTQDTFSRTSAKRHIINEPSAPTFRDIDTEGNMYHQYDDPEPITRDNSYPTVEIAILTPEEAEKEGIEHAKWVRKNRTVSIGEHKLHKHFEPQQYGGEYLENIEIFITNDGVIRNATGMTMQFTDAGLVIQ